MSILVDTPIWSLALRKKVLTDDEQKIVNELANLVENLEVLIIGAIRQEVLSGISDEGRFQKIKKRLMVFTDTKVFPADYEIAAAYSNICRRNGIQGSPIDFLICAVAARLDVMIFSLDKDFQYYAEYLPIKLYPFHPS